MPVVVSDTSPVRALVHLELADLFGSLFEEVLIPPSVVWELEHPRGGSKPILVRDLRGLTVQSVRDQTLVTRFQRELDPGESEAIALAIEVRADQIIVDDLHARAVAHQ